MNQESKWKEDFCKEFNCTSLERVYDPCLAPQWGSYLAARKIAQEEIDNIQGEFAFIMKSFCEKNDKEIEKRDRLLGEAKPFIEHVDSLIPPTEHAEYLARQWLKQYEEMRLK